MESKVLAASPTVTKFKKLLRLTVTGGAAARLVTLTAAPVALPPALCVIPSGPRVPTVSQLPRETACCFCAPNWASASLLVPNRYSNEAGEGNDRGARG